VASQVQGLIVLNKSDYIPESWHAVLLTFATISIAVIFNTLLAKKLPLVEGLVLILHVGGFFAILIPLWLVTPGIELEVPELTATSGCLRHGRQAQMFG